jgi:ADP-dependent NAD(P)H-hydrate dehydratase / NAD(P)H-hydrate epimerase
MSVNEITPGVLKQLLNVSTIGADSSSTGDAMIIAGSVNNPGSTLLAAKAAFRMGCPLVCLAVPGSIQLALTGTLPEAHWLLLPHELGVISEGASDVVFKNLSSTAAVLFGSGVGIQETTGMFLQHLIGAKRIKGSKGSIGFVTGTKEDNPIQKNIPQPIIDGDGLKLLAKIPAWPSLLPATTVLVPTNQEMRLLTHMETEFEIENEIEFIRKYALEWGKIIVYKGSSLIIADSSGKYSVLDGSPGTIHKSGSGSVLSGMISGLCSQGIAPFDAALASGVCFIRAGECAVDKVGHIKAVLASDILEAIPDVLRAAA